MADTKSALNLKSGDLKGIWIQPAMGGGGPIKRSYWPRQSNPKSIRFHEAEVGCM